MIFEFYVNSKLFKILCKKERNAFFALVLSIGSSPLYTYWTTENTTVLLGCNLEKVILQGLKA
jgi:hypothetical protein